MPVDADPGAEDARLVRRVPGSAHQRLTIPVCTRRIHHPEIWSLIPRDTLASRAEAIPDRFQARVCIAASELFFFEIHIIHKMGVEDVGM